MCFVFYVVSRPSTEVEYKAMGSVACEITWVLQFLKDLKIQHPKLAMFYDNQVALHIEPTMFSMKEQNILRLIAT